MGWINDWTLGLSFFFLALGFKTISSLTSLWHYILTSMVLRTYNRFYKWKHWPLGDIHCKVLRAFMFTAQDGETYKMENNLLHKMEKNIKWKTI